MNWTGVDSNAMPLYNDYYAERHYVFHLPHSVCLSVCLCVCHHVCEEMARLSNTQLSEEITLDISSKMQHYQDDTSADPDHMDHSYKITFCLITSKLMNGFAPNFTCR